MLSKLAVLALIASTAYAACPNNCAGHGTCGNDDVCTCYQDWLTGDSAGGDCSQRRCPFDHAWVDEPSASNTAHALKECSGKGICDRKTGECECFDGYWGKACRRAQCPNDCSGHGTCEYMKELRNDVGDQFKWTGQAPTSDQYYHTFTGLWDFDRQMACLCDPKWTDVDCSRRMCPKGNYALYSDFSHTSEVQKFDMAATGTDGTTSAGVNQQFAFIFRSTLGEEFTSRPITMGDEDSTGNDAATIQNVLKALPNRVIEDVVVTVTSDGSSGAAASYSVTFAGACNSGNQYLMNTVGHYCGAGCMPYLGTGSMDQVSEATAFFTLTQVDGDDVNQECSGRGICDYESGICECFSGYTDESCSTQTALI